MTFATRETEPALLGPEEYARSRAAFWGGSAVLFTDADGRVLVVEPRYREGLLLPGGGMDAGERPSYSAAREVAEELALTIRPTRLLAVDWVSGGHQEYAQFSGFPGEAMYVWDGGVLGPDALARIVLPPAELGAFHLLPPGRAAALMGELDGARMLAAYRAAIDGVGPAVLEEGRPTGRDCGALQSLAVVPRIAPGAAGAPGVWAFDGQGRVLVLADREERHCTLPDARHGGLFRDLPVALPARAGAVTRLAEDLAATGPVGGRAAPCPLPAARAAHPASARLLATPDQAAALLGLGAGTAAQARAAATRAAERWGVPRARRGPVELLAAGHG